MLDIKKCMFKVRNTRVGNDFSIMQGTLVDCLISQEAKKELRDGATAVTSGDYAVVLLESRTPLVEEELVKNETKVELQKDIMRKNKKVK